MTKKKLYIISLAAFTIIVSAVLFMWAYNTNAKGRARPTLYDEITAFEESTEKVKTHNEELEKQIEDIETELSSKDTVNSYYMEYKKTHDDLTVEVESLKKQSDDLDDEIEKKRRESGGIENLTEGKKGKTYSLTADEIYTCPDKIPAGRYTAKGSGTFTIMTSSGKARVSQNLDVAYDNSYTFNLTDKERIRVTGEVTLTELR